MGIVALDAHPRRRLRQSVMLGSMRWPWFSRSQPRSIPDLIVVWPEPPKLPDRPSTDEDDQRYYRARIGYVADLGLWWLDHAAIQLGPEWMAASTELGKAYMDASVAMIAIGDRLGLMGEQRRSKT